MASPFINSGVRQCRGVGGAFPSHHGFGDSQDRVTATGPVTDAHTADDWLCSPTIAARQIVLVAEFLGIGVAVQLAARVPVAAVALTVP